MQLPHTIRAALEEIAAEAPARELAQAAGELSDAYRTGAVSQIALRTAAHHIAYLLVRTPATFAACSRVFAEIGRLARAISLRSMLDLGAGPGIAAWAACAAIPELQRITLIERDAGLIEIGKRVARALPSALANAVWMQQDVQISSIAGQGSTGGDEKADLVMLSYALGEMRDVADVTRAAWQQCGKLLVMIEPGTPRGFANILAARDALAHEGAQIVAPCPRATPHTCPMAEARDWCHFAARVERTSLHRRLKGGELAHEDEKFSYVVFSREPRPTAAARIVRHPQAHAGHIQLVLCTPAGVERRTASKRNKEEFRAARRSAWGDEWVGDL